MSDTKAKVSLCMIAYNEADMIGECLRTADSAVDEIIVGIDSRTTDETESIAGFYEKARVFRFDWHSDFSEARNQAIERAHNKWILVLDADERLTVAGKAAIARAITSAPDIDAFQMGIEHRTLFANEVISRDWSTRLFKAHLRYQYPVHEDVYGKTLCQIQTDTAHVLHYGYDPNVFRERHKLVRNLDILEKWIGQDPFHPQPNYYMAKIMYERGRVGAAATFAAVAMLGNLSDKQKETLQRLASEYLPE